MILSKRIKLSLIILIICLSGSQLRAQFSKRDLTGRYSMNHDGWEGTLVIEQRKVDCSNTPWCDLNIYYIDTRKNTLKAGISMISDDWQHISFIIAFPDHRQQFTGHLFSWNKNLMAGTTEWGGVTYGFYARKQATLSLDPSLVRGEGRYHNVYEFKRNLNENMSEEPDKIVKRGINKEGEVEIQYGSGKKVIYGEGSTLVITPEKDSLRMMYMQVMDLVPPLPDDPEIKEWIGTLNNNMDDIVQHLLDDNEESFSNYRDALSEYSLVERINEGMKMIGFLIE